MAKALSVYLGAEAAAQIKKEGWSADLFSGLLGASGGPKWFILGHLDRFLFGDYLQRSSGPLSVMGSSIGSWRHACLAMPDPVAAIEQLEQGYMHQRYTGKPTAPQVSEVSLGILDKVLGQNGARELVNHSRIRTHIVTARGRGLSSSASGAKLAMGMGAAALSNTLGRPALSKHFQRVVFHSADEPATGFSLHDFDTCYSRLQAEGVRHALHASGAIPFVLAGERNIPGAPEGQYWDGGIVDYHFDLQQYQGEGLLLYPHFSSTIVSGWFDKFLPWRKSDYRQANKLVLLCPSDEFIDSLPLQKIPDRSDFTGMDDDARINYWAQCVERSRELAQEFIALTTQRDPLAGVKILDPTQ